MSYQFKGTRQGSEGKFYRNPGSSGHIPQAGSQQPDQNVWVEMRAYKITSQQAIQRGDPRNFTKIDFGASINLPTFMFLAPNDLIETTSHTWDEYESIMSRLGQKATEVYKELLTSGKAAGITVGQVYSEIQNALSGQSHESLLNLPAKLAKTALAGMAGNVKVYNSRMDLPLVYKGSERRSLELTFNLIEEGNGAGDIIEPVKVLQSLSSPSRTQSSMGSTDAANTSFGGLIDIQIPYIFSVRTYPKAWFNLRYGALRTVQPTFKGPYVDGYPSSCELLLSFQNLEPLYADEFTGTFGDLNQIITHAPLDQIKGGQGGV
jgi:hypothetical protein